jgi:hypothetical protein
MANKIYAAFLALGVIAIVGGVDAQETGKKAIATPTAPNAIGPYSQEEPEVLLHRPLQSHPQARSASGRPSRWQPRLPRPRHE